MFNLLVRAKWFERVLFNSLGLLLKRVIMKFRYISLLLLLFTLPLSSQSVSFGGFIRSGLYLSAGDYDQDINSLFADISLITDVSDNKVYRGFADIRARTGQQFGENSDFLLVREAWCSYYSKGFAISAGKKILKWGKSDFYTPLSKFNPIDYSLRTPDREDADMGEIIFEVSVTPLPAVKLSLVASPLWNPSVMITKPLKLGDNIHLTLPEGFLAGNGYYSYGFRADFTMKGVDWGLQWFHGADPMPGLQLDSADFSDLLNPDITMSGVPYIINSYGADFEASVSSFVVRGTLSLFRPEGIKSENEEIPFSQLEWVAGIDWNPGTFHITGEYSGKKILDYYKPPYDPLLGTEPDIAQLAELFMTPGFDPVEFARLQVEASNRLYNYQMKEFYNSAGLRIELDALYGRLMPSFTCMYNFTAHDLVLIPSVKYKPSDSISIVAGMEYYSGSQGGLYDIIDDFMNAAFFSIRVDF